MEIFKVKTGLLIGAGWKPSEYLIDEAKNFGHFKKCDEVLCIEGPGDINPHVAMFMYHNMILFEKDAKSDEKITYGVLNMDSGKTLYAVYTE